MESIVGTPLKYRGLIFVHQVIIDMPQFMMQSPQLLLIDLNALFNSGVIAIIYIPGTGVAHHIAISRLFKHRVLIKALWQCRQAKRGKETLCGFSHTHLIVALLNQRSCHI